MRKILFIDHEPTIGGSTVSLGFLLKYFSERSWSVEVSTPKNDRDGKYFHDRNAGTIPCNPFGITTLALDLHFTNTVPLLTRRGIAQFVKNVLKLFIGIRVYYRQIRQSAPDIVYVNEYVSIQASIAAVLAGIPCVMHIRSLALTGGLGIRRRLLRSAVLRFNDLVIPIARREAEQFSLGSDKYPNRMTVVGEFLGPENFQLQSDAGAGRAAWNLPAGKKIVLMLGGMSVVKGTLDFLRGAQAIVRTRNDIIFLIAGNEYRVEQPAYCAECDALMATEFLHDTVRTLGVVSNAIALIGCCDVLVSSNVTTHFSRPIIEAWSLGKPIVATATAHNEELVSDGVDGLVVPIGDPNAMAAAILRIIDDEAFARMLGGNGRDKATRHYHADANLNVIYTQCERLALAHTPGTRKTAEGGR